MIPDVGRTLAITLKRPQMGRRERECGSADESQFIQLSTRVPRILFLLAGRIRNCSSDRSEL